MIEYTIQNITCEPHDLDDEVIYFDFEIHFTEPEESVVDYSFPLSNVLKFINAIDAEFYTYWEKTRKSTGIWGPAEHSTIEAIGEAAQQQMNQYLERHLREQKYIETFYERLKADLEKTPEQQMETAEQVVKIFDNLREAAKDFKEYSKRYRLFCQALEKQIRATALDIYPEIADLESDYLLKFERLFVRDIQEMQSKLETLLYENNKNKA